MSDEALPISPARFAEALKDLPLEVLHLKAMELRNSIAHLDYSNEQLEPFATGREGSNTPGHPDQDCVDAIKENCIVIERMKERIALLRAEVEERGSSWLEFQSSDEVTAGREEGAATGLVNGTGERIGEAGESASRSQAWTDGTFQTGRIVNGEVRMDQNRQGSARMSASSDTPERGLDDEALRRAVEERIRALNDDEEDEGMHL